MPNLDELIARAELMLAENQWTSGWGVEALAEELCDALESVRAERDAALEVMNQHKCGENVEAAYRRAVNAEARIAELEKSRDRWEELCGKIASEKYDLNARIAEAAKLHRPVEIEPSSTICGHCSFQLPNGRYFGKIIEWPCPTAVALGLNEGENND